MLHSLWPITPPPQASGRRSTNNIESLVSPIINIPSASFFFFYFFFTSLPFQTPCSIFLLPPCLVDSRSHPTETPLSRPTTVVPDF